MLGQFVLQEKNIESGKKVSKVGFVREMNVSCVVKWSVFVIGSCVLINGGLALSVFRVALPIPSHAD